MDSTFQEIEENLTSPVLRPNGMMYLSDKYIPEKPLYREGHIRELVSEIYEMVEMNLPGIILLEGPTGTGKTMCYSIAESFLLRKMANEGLDAKLVYVNARGQTTTGILVELLHRLGVPAPRTGFSFGKYLSELKKVAGNYHVHICIDEVDTLKEYKNYRVTDILYHFSRSEGISASVITNDSLFVEKIMDARVRSTLTLEKAIVFEKYTKEQCFDILAERCRLAFVDGAVSDELLDEIAEIASEPGDIRYGLEILRACARICRIEKLKKIDSDTLKKAVEMVGANRIVLRILALSDSQKLVLLSYLLNYLRSSKLEQSVEEIFNTYFDLRERLGKKAVTINDLRNRISELVTYGLFKTEKIGKGPKKGVETHYKLNFSPYYLAEAVKRDPVTAPVFRESYGAILEERKKTFEDSMRA
uniref:ORC1-type DNA replication protein n=1 Tax=Archaeoglobus fulgidus TaxID=2234 RepID=A0A7C3RLU2_ARCFL